MGLRIFYDKYETVSLWGKDLYTHLREVYFRKSKFTVMFLSEHYREKLWTNHERESAQARAFTEKSEYILPARFDDTAVPGVLPTIGYISLQDYSPEEFALLIKQKIGHIARSEFFPDFPDRLLDYFELSTDDEINTVIYIAYKFFEQLKLMTPEERYILATACNHACPAGFPDNAHINLEYLGRLTATSRDSLIATFSRLDCLNIKSRIYENSSHRDEHSLTQSSGIIEIRLDLYEDFGSISPTDVMAAVFDCVFNNFCESCAERAMTRLDLSALGNLTSFDEIHS